MLSRVRYGRAHVAYCPLSAERLGTLVAHPPKLRALCAQSGGALAIPLPRPATGQSLLLCGPKSSVRKAQELLDLWERSTSEAAPIAMSPGS